jgi:DNA-binding LytR/AlgR family response regulator
MLKIAICDDNRQELDTTWSMVMDFSKARPETDFSVRRFQSSFELLDCVEAAGSFHLYLLDIIMPVLNGIDIGAIIRQKDENAIIIYLTSSADYAVKSYKVFAFQYLMKPVAQEELFATLDKALTKMDQQTAKSIAVKTRDGITSLRLHRVVFVEYASHSLLFHLSDQSVIKSVTSREPFDTTACELLKDPRFIRPHVSFVVNMSFINSISGSCFVLTDGFQVSISRSNYADAKKSYIDFLLKGEDPN